MTITAEPFPTTLREVRQEIPKEFFEPDTGLAVRTLMRVLAQVVVSSAFAWIVWRQGWWFLAPVSWAAGSIAMAAMFVAGHDCGHRSLLRSNRVMVILGHVFHSPVLYPFWSWKYSHDAHHRDTNLLDRGEGVYFDNAWTPYMTDHYAEARQRRRPVTWVYQVGRLVPPLGTMLHLFWILWMPQKYRAGRHRNRVLFSMAVTVATAIGISTALWIGFGSPWAVLHFFLIPVAGVHCWMSLYTYFHHTSTDVTFHHAEEWNPFVAQMDGTINAFTPRWISYLHMNIDVHIPHHVSTRIPSYHLRAANAALKTSKWGPIMRERKLSLRYMIETVKTCHLWSDERGGYVRFNEVD